MSKFQIDSIQEWESFCFDGVTYSLSHLDAHKVVYERGDQRFEFVVTYGLHCFTKDDSLHTIDCFYADGNHTRRIEMERYEASKELPRLINGLSGRYVSVFETSEEKFFTINLMNSLSGEVEPYKIAFTMYKEKRLKCLHVLTAYFERTGEGSEDKPMTRKGRPIFSFASALERKNKRLCFPVKEVLNRKI